MIDHNKALILKRKERNMSIFKAKTNKQIKKKLRYPNINVQNVKSGQIRMTLLPVNKCKN